MNCAGFARKIRAHALRMVSRSNASHIGTCLSMADLLAVLYTSTLKISPETASHPERDRFILSKGHGAAIMYAALAERGFFPLEWLDRYSLDGSPLTGHVNHKVPGVEISTGSLGHGLPIGCGMALAGKRGGNSYRTFVLLSDGELDEGSNWEAILFAAHHKLDNLVAVIDYNQIQSFGSVSEVMELAPLADKWRAFNWRVLEINGHDLEEIGRVFRSLPLEPGKPSVIIAHTVKGRGVSYMEGQLAWHYRSPNPDLLARALAELEAGA